ncbi:E3 ubiquitin-protein ligase TRIM9-like isoform X2 [Lineus longissimus]|uniref:E3 ubiquitin-protein ligase TRIM9-like isoform X2 n=1 Tax=Lineus longissimus TaxID=88925 RepID=UPI00315CB7E3
MEVELKCPVCCRLYCNPVLLPCSHSLCLACAVSVQVPSQQLGTNSEENNSGLPDLDYPDIDKLSLVSETDSGVVVNSRPSSYVGTPSIGNIYFQSSQGSTLGLSCPSCRRNVYFDETGANSLPKNRVLESIVDKYGENKKIVVKCQMCEKDPHDATSMCEQCEVFYCQACRDSCHPPRGPLAKHNLVAPSEGKQILRAKNKTKETQCPEHQDETLSMYCTLCKVTCCYLCVQDGPHTHHDVQALGAMCKAQKAELSQILQTLSEKARTGTEFIQRLKSLQDRVQENCLDFESSVVAQCDALIDAIRLRKQQLLDNIEREKDQKIMMFRDQVAHCTGKLQRTTGLLQFSIEVLKEQDPNAFLQVAGPLINRVGNADLTFNKEMELEPRIQPDFEWTLDNSQAMHAVTTLNFFQMKDGLVAPDAPLIIPEDCTAENNSVTIAWQPHLGSIVDVYTLELDDGNEGAFREVYCGRETICTVDGLHFDSMYQARVKAHNHAGESIYSEPICLQTAEVAWFQMDPGSTTPDVIFTGGNLTLTCTSYEDRVILGNVGFSKGVHYWEICIDRYDNQPDPAFGIARFDVNKESVLGKDDKGWCMYIDSSRSWFRHNGEHTGRTDGGIQKGSIVGVLLDLNQHMISFYVNEEPHGPIAFTNLHGVFFPAISLNRNVQVSMHTGLDIPCDSDTEDE